MPTTQKNPAGLTAGCAHSSAARDDSAISRLLQADDPAVRYKVLVNVLGLDPDSVQVAAVRMEVRASGRVRRLLAARDADGCIPHGPYAKWYGRHLVLTTLADIGYPPGDAALIPLREQEYAWLLSEKHEKAIRTLRNACAVRVTGGVCRFRPADPGAGRLPDGGADRAAAPLAVARRRVELR